MLRIGKLTDYALLILSAMAKESHLVLSAAYLAETLHLKFPTVSKILKILSERDLVSSVRGAEGGYRLARNGDDITLVDILQAMEGEFALTECCKSTKLCAIDSMCLMRENWRKINRMVQSLLCQLTLTDMLKPLSLNTLPVAFLEEKKIAKQEAHHDQ